VVVHVNDGSSVILASGRFFRKVVNPSSPTENATLREAPEPEAQILVALAAPQERLDVSVLGLDHPGRFRLRK
jgi:hypothetical protein